MVEEVLAKSEVEGCWPLSEVPTRRVGGSDGIAGIILLLASEAGAYVNGKVLVTDGGWLSVLSSSY